ncbi:hypothetical protein [Hymenobacter defluvii]|uniref:Type II CBASS E2 protein domain-containing protein n=1 Tax=Hymenobacter defluvii TaxID=2054411 RepID=A0ABS3TED5_9BACT|nr:hypothetical protein [Hymenobacter defluvii]MBO3272021.1 hypothetical protein [Hymenobacter defluvii]
MFQGIRPLTLAQQLGSLRQDWPEGQGQLTKHGLSWLIPLQPTPLSRIYVIRLTYSALGQWPHVHVVSPSLRALAGTRKIPHLYCQRTIQLCLFAPWLREWKPQQRISRTLVLWAKTWLYYFEDWLVTDDWQGGGIAH